MCIHQDYPQCVRVIIKALRNRWHKDPYSLIFLSDSITDLNKMGVDGLHTIYNFSLQRSFLKSLPKFCDSKNLPIVSLNSSIETDYLAVLGNKANVIDGNAITFQQSYFKVNMHLGSSEGIEFLESVVDCQNTRIFETQFIQIILQEKWKKARYVMYGQSMVFLGFIVTLAYYSTLGREDKKFLLPPAVFNGILLLNEFFQLYAGGMDYFQDIWNYVDLVRSSLFFIYAIMVWLGAFTVKEDFLALIILVTWVRGVTYFRIFGPIRYLINLLFEVFIDIPSFLLIYFYTILAFSFMFFAMNTDPTQDYYQNMCSTYSISLGNAAVTETDQIVWIFYVLITLFNFIIMLNLLISILSDTYGRVKDGQIIADSLELASMVMEVEMMLFWRRNMNEKQFLHICTVEGSTEIGLEDLVVNKFRSMQEKLGNYEKVLEENLSSLDYLKTNMEQKNTEFSDIIDKIENKYKLKD